MADDLDPLLDRAEHMAHSDPAGAERLARNCTDAAEDRGLHGCAARGHYVLARIDAERGDLDTAVRHVEDARAAWLRAGSPVSALRTDLGRMTILDDLGRHAEAVAVGEALLADLATVDVPAADEELVAWIRAAAAENIAVAVSFTGDYERALAGYAEAEARYHELGLTADVARPQANRGIELLSLGRAREALVALESAAETFELAGDRLWTAKCLGNVGQAHHQLGNLHTALEILHRARDVAEELGAAAEVARLQVSLAAAYLDVGLADEAATEAGSAVAATEHAGMAHDTAVARSLLTVALLRCGDINRAEEQARGAQDQLAEVGDRLELARLRLVQSAIAEAQGRRGEAAALAAESAGDLADGGWPAALAWANLRCADLAATEEERDRLLRAADVTVADLSLPLLAHEHDLRMARRRRETGDVAGAVELLHGAVDRVERLGGRLGDHVLRTAFRCDKLAAHDELVDLLVAAGSPAEACAVSERARARTLVELTARRSEGRGPAPHAETDRDPLTVDLLAVYAALHSSTEPARRAALRRDAADLERRLAASRARRSATRGNSRSRAEAATVTADDVLAAAPALCYHVCGADVIAFVVGHGEVVAQRLPGATSTVATLLRELELQARRSRTGRTVLNRHPEALLAAARSPLHSLYEVLVAPVAGMLADLGRTELTVVPHALLGNVPFAALLDGDDPLLARWEVTIAPTLLGGRPGGRGDDGELARPQPQPVGALVIAVADDLAPLAEAEGRGVAALVPGARLVSGDAATADVLLACSPPPSILHIATHGMFHVSDPLLSRLRFADRWVTVAEITGLDLTGSLVVVSACESGRQGGSAEPVGLAWAFLAAGARGVVVSRWAVSDEIAVALSTEFYRALGDGATPAAALRRAQLRLAALDPDPAGWAAFSYIAGHHRPASFPVVRSA